LLSATGLYAAKITVTSGADPGVETLREATTNAVANDTIVFVSQVNNLESVEINGIIWATRNVDNFGTFAENPESLGKIYQWNRPTAWSATEPTVNNWNTSYPTGTEWETQNDPCPVGWHVPTLQEINALLANTSNSWVTNYKGTGINGRVFTNGVESLFFPAVGGRCSNYGNLLSPGAIGVYWSSTSLNNTNAYFLYFDNGSAVSGSTDSRTGRSVRCVKCNVIKTYTVSFAGEEINIAPQTVNHGSTATQPATPERTGYNFVGWFTDNGTFLNQWNFASSIVTKDTTLYAKWQIKTYTVSFAGEEINITPQTVNHGSHATQPATPERTGYNFVGWFTDNGTFLNQWNFASSIVTKDTTLYAKWQIKTYTVSFAGEEINIAPQTVNHGSHATQPATPERTGYNFVGWFTDNGTFLNQWNFASSIVTKDTTLYAKWQIKTYTVSFAGEEINIAPQTVNHGGTATQPNNPERTGYNFMGWFTDNGTFLNQWNFASSIVTKDTTLYAKWQIKTYTVSFAGEEINIAPQTVNHGGTATQPATPERIGFDFVGWFTDNGTFLNQWNFASSIVTKDTTLYAKWQIKTYTVSFAGEEINITPQAVNHGSTATQPATPERIGFDFVGWFTDNGTFLNQWNFASSIVTKDTTLYAKWQIKSYTVSFVGEEINIAPQTVEHGGKVAQPDTPERIGYDFVGWFTDNGTFLEEWNFETDIVTQDTTLYAKWKKKNGIITCYNAGVKIYPNPTLGVLQVTTSNYPISKIKVFSTSGKDVQFNYIPITTYHYQIDISGLQSGIYIIEISTEYGKSSVNLVKQ